MAVPELYQFSFSHFNEKARWALDYKGIVHRRHSLLPGPHIPYAIWLSGKKSTPILRDNQKIISGSAEIIDHLEQRYPKRTLYPRALQPRKRALEIQHWFDEDIGAPLRRALFHEMLDARRYAANTFSNGFPKPVRAAYRLAFPGLVPLLKADMRITRRGFQQGLEITQQALDFVAENSGEDGYLVDDHFTVADLTAASLLMPTCFPPEFQFVFETEPPPEIQSWLARWRDHPGTQWVRRMFRRHRGSSAEIDNQ